MRLKKARERERDEEGYSLDDGWTRSKRQGKRAVTKKESARARELN